MADDFDPTFEKVDSGASLTVPIPISDVKKGSHICMGDNRPCKVMEITTSKTGKHGHAKANITGIDIFNGKKYQDVAPVSHSKEAPNITRKEYTVMSIDDEGYVSLLDKLGTIRSDLTLPKDSEDDQQMSQKIQNAVEEGKTVLVTVLGAMAIEKIEDFKESNDQ